MNSFRFQAVSALTALLIFSGVSHAQDSSLVRVLKESALEMRLVDGRLQGKGADALTAEARANQFLLVGEDHGTREAPEFVGGLFDLARAAGYTHLAVEVGPITTRKLETMMRSASAQRDLD